jgi:uncharacterized repeat protein (TIGR01451 family)
VDSTNTSDATPASEPAVDAARIGASGTVRAAVIALVGTIVVALIAGAVVLLTPDPPPASPPSVVINNTVIPAPGTTANSPEPSICPDDGDVAEAGPEWPLLLALKQKTESVNCWTSDVKPVYPKERIRYLIEYRNISDLLQTTVVLRATLPPNVTLIPGSTVLYNEKHPNGMGVKSDNITQGGLGVGSYGPGANAYLRFDAVLPGEQGMACGDNTFHAEAWGRYAERVETSWILNSSNAVANRPC